MTVATMTLTRKTMITLQFPATYSSTSMTLLTSAKTLMLKEFTFIGMTDSLFMNGLRDLLERMHF